METPKKPFYPAGIIAIIAFVVCIIAVMECKAPSPASREAAPAADSAVKMQAPDTAETLVPLAPGSSVGTQQEEKHQTQHYYSLKKKVIRTKPPVGAEKNPINGQPVTTEKDLKYGILGYSYPPSIRVGDSKTIHAFISIQFPESKVRDTLAKIVLSDDSHQTGDSVVIVKAIRLYKEVTMTLECMDTVLRVTPIHPSASQLIDTVNGNKWSWDIYAKTADRPRSKLKLTITTTGPSSYEEKTLVINIKVESNIVRITYDYLMDNPKVLVSSIMIPLVGFFGARYFKKRKKRRASNT